MEGRLHVGLNRLVLSLSSRNGSLNVGKWSLILVNDILRLRWVAYNWSFFKIKE